MHGRRITLQLSTNNHLSRLGVRQCDGRIMNHPRGMILDEWIMFVPTVVPYTGSWRGQRGMEAVMLTCSLQCAVAEG